MSDCPNDPNNGYGSHNTTHTLPCNQNCCKLVMSMPAQQPNPYAHLLTPKALWSLYVEDVPTAGSGDK